jgi:hypothetical protein
MVVEQKKSKKSKKLEKQGIQAGAVAEKKVTYTHFLCKAKLVLKTTNKQIMADTCCVDMIYKQAVHDVTTSRYPCKEKDVTVLAALQLQASEGDFDKSVHQPGWLAERITKYMPTPLIMKKKKIDKKIVKEWEQKILSKYSKVTGFSVDEAKLNYLDYVQEWTFYGSTFFLVEQRQFKDYPSPLTLGINCEGVILMHPQKQTVLEHYGFTDIVTWGHSDEKFIVVVGNIVQQRKLIFKTLLGKNMNHLVHDFVKFKVKSKEV